jgi:hypothetical protein
MRRFIEDFKMKNIAFFLLFFLLVSGHSNANAVGGSIGGWQVVSNVASGIGAKITATKDVLVNGAKTTVTGTANIMPDPSNMGKFMARLGGAAVVSEALNQILDGVDYVMDPVNNTVQYKKENSETQVMPYHKYHWHDAYSNRFFASAKHVCSIMYSLSDFYLGFTVQAVSETKANCMFKQSSGGTFNYGSVYAYPNPAYNPVADQNNKVTVPLNDVASAVIGQAEQDIRVGNPATPAVAATRAVAQDMIQQAEADDVKARPIAQQLEKNPEYPSENDAEGEITKPEVIDPATGEVVKPAETSSIAMKFPKACEWFPQACLFIDWVMTDPNVDSDMEVPEKEIEKQEIKKDLVKISGRSCPADVKFDVDGLPFGIKVNKAYSMQEICNTVEPLKYVFELITAVICALILLRV